MEEQALTRLEALRRMAEVACIWRARCRESLHGGFGGRRLVFPLGPGRLPYIMCESWGTG
jgi:hypothetical protein